VTLRSEFERKEKGRAPPKPLLFVVLDELNKYAPREGTARSRSAARHRRAAAGRSAWCFIGRAADRERGRAAHRGANSAIPGRRAGSTRRRRPRPGVTASAARQRQRALLAKPGTMLRGQPEIRCRLCVEFPFPSWATRPGEAGRAPSVARMRSIVQCDRPVRRW
jgi:hypothetical protein